MDSTAILRIMRLRPAIGAGRQARGRAASTKRGCASSQIQACMQPIEVPMMRRRCKT